MKTIVALLFVLSSFTTFASENGVLDAMKTIFRGGNYIGVTPHSAGCVLSINYYADRAEVIASAGNVSVRRTIISGTGYRYNVGTRELLSDDQLGTFRSLAVDQSATYTVTAEKLSSGREKFIECIIR
jgi:hypothetical protein